MFGGKEETNEESLSATFVEFTGKMLKSNSFLFRQQFFLFFN